MERLHIPATTGLAEVGPGLEPQEFMSNTLTRVDSIRAEGVAREPFDLPSALVHEGDIGAVAATALLEDGHAGMAYTLTGPQTVRPCDRVAALSRAIGRELAFVRITREQGVESLMATGVPRADAEYVIGWHADPPVESYTVDDTMERILGRPARTFDDWLAEHAHRLGSRVSCRGSSG